MKSSEILREAARLVNDGTCVYGCEAVEHIARGDDLDRAEARIWDVFWLDGVSRYGADSVWFWGHEPREPARIIGLCLAAAIAESEGD